MRSRRTALSAVLLTAALVSGPAMPAAAKHGTRGARRASASSASTKRTSAIELCCAWGRGITDGISFSVSGPSQARSIMSRAVREWASAVSGLRLAEVSPGQPADVKLGFRAVSGNTQGQATINRDRYGFITGVDIFVAGSYKGKPNSAEILGQITKHEFGHALGLKHANGEGDLMSTTVQAGATNISTCDVKAVNTANAWYLVSRSSEPRRPAVSRVVC